MPVGLVAFEIGALSLGSVRRLRTRTYTEVNAVGKSLRKHLQHILTRARPNHVTALLFSIALYLILSRCGPVLTRVGESTFKTLDLNENLLRLDPVDLQSLKGVYRLFRGLTRVPGPFARRSFSVVYFIMGGKNSKESHEVTPDSSKQEGEGVRVKEAENLQSENPQSENSQEKKVSEQEHKKENSDHHAKKKKKCKGDGDGSLENPYRFSVLEHQISTGDLALLKRAGEDIYHFGIFVQYGACDPAFPLLLIKGKTKPLKEFDPKVKRHAHPVSAVTRIFYGDYEMVAVRQLVPKASITCHDTIKIIDEISEIPFSELEIEAIRAAKSPKECSARLCTFMIAHFYKKMGILEANPEDITPHNLEENLNLSEPKYVRLPPVKEGPVASGDPPFLARLVDGIMPPPDVHTVPLNSITCNLNTGDLVLFSGATSSGAIIKFFDHSEFSHIGIVMKTKYSSSLLIWEASTNKAGLVDIETGKVRSGVELLPLKNKIFSGWYDRVAIRRLTDIDKDKRDKMYIELLKFMKEVQGRPYEQSKMELILSAIDFQEEYLSFLRNTKEDLSSLFCSELVAEAYMRMGLWSRKKLANEYTPDDFASKSDLINPLEFGKLEKEEYIELKFDFN